jgi:hypothetical protein
MMFVMRMLLLLFTLMAAAPAAGLEFAGRASPEPLYRIKVPSGWQQLSPQGNRLETTTPIAEFSIDNRVRITIHNFPISSVEESIPPTAQISRWKRQFERLDQTSLQLTPQAFSGYAGLLIEGSGLLQGKPTALMGWALQLAPDYFRLPLTPDIYGDVTIKVQGDPSLVQSERKAIMAFARSFELIHPLPLPP